MGQRSRTESVARVLAAFLSRRTWIQAELAREVGIRTEALRCLLEELVASGLPLESQRDHPHVYWSVPKAWFPGGVLFRQEDVPDLVRQLRRLPRSRVRDRLLATVDAQLPKRAPPPAAPVATRATTDQEELYVPVVEDAAAKNVSLWMRYFTASRGSISERHASVHVVDIGPPARFVATCHRSGELRWFRVDCITSAHLDGNVPFRPADADAVAAFRAASLDGFKGAGAIYECSFFVRNPEARWVANNLLEGMRAEPLSDGLRVHARTSAVLRLARFVVGLGGAAHPEHPALSEAVAELAGGALSNARRVDLARNPTVPESGAPAPVRLSSDVQPRDRMDDSGRSS